MYEIYGNLFVHNPREALFQGSGRFSLHDNIFLDGCPRYPAVVLTKQNEPLKVAFLYHNTVYTSGQGIRFENAALTADAVVGNLVFASSHPIEGPINVLADNITGSLEMASRLVKSPSFDLSTADFYPLPGKCQGTPIELTSFQSDSDYTLDFNGKSKIQAKANTVFRGAYADEGQNSGWKLQAGLKAPSPPAPRLPRLIWIRPSVVQPGREVQLILTGVNFSDGASVAVSGDGVSLMKTGVDGPTQIRATLIVAPGAQSGTRDVTVTTSMGVSNPLRFQLQPK